MYVGNLNSKVESERIEAINTLGSIGDKRTVQFLIPILDDKRLPQKHGEHGMPVSFSDLAEQSLHNILPDVVQEFRKKNPRKRFYLHDEWKEWWKSAKSDYEVPIK